MAITQPEVLFVLNEASGNTVTNDGTSGNAVVEEGGTTADSEGTAWDWNQDQGSYDGYWESHVAGNNSSDMPSINLTGISFNAGTDYDEEWCAIGFELDAYDTAGSGKGFFLGTTSLSDTPGGIAIYADDPTAGGDFDLNIRLSNVNGTRAEYIYTGLTFGTFYQLAIRSSGATSGSVTLHTKLGSNSVQTDGANLSSGTYRNATFGYLGRGNQTKYYGINGRIYYFAYDSTTTITDSDLADINSDPAGTIGGWPGSISITDVANSGETPGSGSESWEDGSSGNVITGSGFV